jgi:hypothetical protein
MTKQDMAWEKLRKMLEANPKLMAVFIRMKNR